MRSIDTSSPVRRRGAALLGWMWLVVAASVAQASPSAVPPPQAAGVVAREFTRAQVIDLLQRRYRAQVVRADVSDESGRRLYVCRLLSGSSKVWIVRIDARSGQEVP